MTKVEEEKRINKKRGMDEEKEKEKKIDKPTEVTCTPSNIRHQNSHNQA